MTIAVNKPIDLATVSIADFQPLLNDNFAVDTRFLGLAADGSPVLRDDVYPSDVSVSLQLVEVSARKPYGADSRVPFALLFRDDGGRMLYSDVHVLQHPSLGQFSVLLTSVQAPASIRADADANALFYEAIFN